MKCEGYIAYYGLEDWWFATFSQEERAYIESRYNPMGASPNSLTQGNILEISVPVTTFLNGLNTWFRNSKDASIAERIHQKIILLGQEHPIDKPGYYKGRHFTTYVNDVKRLKKNNNEAELENLLINLVLATENESAKDGSDPAPWYYHELALLYRKQKEYAKEVNIISRYLNHTESLGVRGKKLVERLGKAQELLEAQGKVIS